MYTRKGREDSIIAETTIDYNQMLLNGGEQQEGLLIVGWALEEKTAIYHCLVIIVVIIIPRRSVKYSVSGLLVEVSFCRR